MSSKSDFIKPERKDYIDPVSYYNAYKVQDAVQLFNLHHKKTLFIDDGRTKSDEVVVMEDGSFEINEHSSLKVPQKCTLTPFQILMILRFKKNFSAAVMHVEQKEMKREIPFCRVGVDYFKIIKKPDRYGIDRTELKRWTKSELITDYGKNFPEVVPKFDDFTIEPSNKDYQPVIRSGANQYRNLYAPFEHKAEGGDLKWTNILMKHVFGEQYEQGVKYMQWVYLKPKQILPILTLVSKERGTGKTTFLNWLSQIYGANMVTINPEDLTGSFNGMYARSNIIAIEETFIDKETSVEKLKALATAKNLAVNQKHIDNYSIPFFGKIIMCTNKVKNFARIDDDEIRFWTRKLGTIDVSNPNIEDDLVKEIPAFLHFLESQPMPEIKSRMGFLPEEIETKELLDLKAESKPAIYKEILINVDDYFESNTKELDLKVTLKDIKDRWFSNQHNYNKAYIKTILQDEMNMKPTHKPQRYKPFNEGIEKTGRYYTFKCDVVREDLDKVPF